MNRSEAGKLGYEKSKEKFFEIAINKKNNYFNNPKRCNFCNNAIEYELRRNIYCSKSCAAKNNNLHKKIPCAGCGRIENKTRGAKFCKNCIALDLNRPLKAKTLDVCKTDRTRREVLIRIYGVKCWICCNEQWNEKSIPLELDHIDGHHEHNNKENLRLLCPNCHAQTTTYKGKNKGNGRIKRRNLR